VGESAYLGVDEGDLGGTVGFESLDEGRCVEDSADGVEEDWVRRGRGEGPLAVVRWM
jgi:hypothetical protein